MSSSSIAALTCLTRRLAQATIRPSVSVRTVSKAFVASLLSSNNPLHCTAIRYKSGGKKKKKPKKEDTTTTPSQQEQQQQPSVLHQNWVELQQSIAVDGFDTGQITTATANIGKKRRGGKAIRRREAKQMELDKKTADRERMVANLGGGEFPPLRYSDEETERLLKIAYDAIPKRGGKRGHRNLQRQKLRWFRVRKIHAKQKFWRIRAHGRRMMKRSKRVKNVLDMKAQAPEIRERDRKYQEEVFKRWARETMQLGVVRKVVEDDEGGVVTEELVSNKEQKENA